VNEISNLWSNSEAVLPEWNEKLNREEKNEC